MSEKKKAAKPAEAKKANAAVYTREKLLTFEKYANWRDLLSALLVDGETYTVDQVDGLIAKFMKGKVR